MPLQREVLPPAVPAPWNFTMWIASGILTCFLLFVAIALVGIATEPGRRPAVPTTNMP